MPQTWLTSDLHFGHAFVAGLRGFEHVDAHDQAILSHWGRVVGADDDIWVVGDFALGRWREALAQISGLPGRKHLVTGNHDRCWPGAKNGHAYLREYLTVFETVQSVAMLRADGEQFFLSHFPYSGDTVGRAGDRHTQLRLRDEGVPLIHGHTHGTETSGLSSAGTPMIHVGLDARGMRFVPMGQVVTELREVRRASKQVRRGR